MAKRRAGGGAGLERDFDIGPASGLHRGLASEGTKCAT